MPIVSRLISFFVYCTIAWDSALRTRCEFGEDSKGERHGGVKARDGWIVKDMTMTNGGREDPVISWWHVRGADAAQIRPSQVQGLVEDHTSLKLRRSSGWDDVAFTWKPPGARDVRGRACSSSCCSRVCLRCILILRRYGWFACFSRTTARLVVLGSYILRNVAKPVTVVDVAVVMPPVPMEEPVFV